MPSILSGANKALGDMIPLIMRKNELDLRRTEAEEALRREEEKEAEAMKREVMKVKTDFAKQLFLEGYKGGDTQIVNKLGPMLEQQGFSLPKEQVPGGNRYLTLPEKEKEKTPTTIEALLAKQVEAGEDPTQTLQIMQKVAQAKAAGKDKAGRELNTYQEAAIYYRSIGDENKAKFYENLVREGKSEAVGTTPQERSRRQLEDDIQQVLGQLGGIEAGQNIMTEALGSERKAVAERKRKRLKSMLKEYDTQYGSGSAKSRFGVSSSDFSTEDIMSQLPPAADYAGKKIRDRITGKLFESDGTNWNEVK